MTAHRSWLQLEQYALGELPTDARSEVEDHVTRCALCKSRLHEIAADARPLPELSSRPSRLARGWGAGLAVPLALAAMLWLIPWTGFPPELVRYKGGELAITVVRERDGAVAENPAEFRSGDRLKVLLTCPPGERPWRVLVTQGAEAHEPLGSGELSCGNRVPLPGAFRVSGESSVAICAHLDADAEVATRGPATVCLNLHGSSSGVWP